MQLTADDTMLHDLERVEMKRGINPSSPMLPIAQRAVTIADQRGGTPVLLVQRGLVVGRPFVAELAAALVAAAERSVRIEVLFSPAGALGVWHGFQRERMTDRLRRSMPADLRDQIDVQRRGVLSRPGGVLRPLVVGWGTIGDPLPSWGVPLRLTTEPAHTSDIHLLIA